MKEKIIEYDNNSKNCLHAFLPKKHWLQKHQTIINSFLIDVLFEIFFYTNIFSNKTLRDRIFKI